VSAFEKTSSLINPKTRTWPGRLRVSRIAQKHAGHEAILVSMRFQESCRSDLGAYKGKILISAIISEYLDFHALKTHLEKWLIVSSLCLQDIHATGFEGRDRRRVKSCCGSELTFRGSKFGRGISFKRFSIGFPYLSLCRALISSNNIGRIRSPFERDKWRNSICRAVSPWKAKLLRPKNLIISNSDR
jgi:hypothetical protein